MEQKIKITKASPKHCVAIYQLLKRVYEEIPGFPVMEEGPSIQCILNTIATGYCLIAVQDGKLIGSIGIVPEKFVWSSQVSFGRTFWWAVDKVSRGSKTANLLLEKARKDCEEVGGTLIVDQITAFKPHAFGRLLERKGAKYLGGAYIFGSLGRG